MGAMGVNMLNASGAKRSWRESHPLIYAHPMIRTVVTITNPMHQWEIGAPHLAGDSKELIWADGAPLLIIRGDGVRPRTQRTQRRQRPQRRPRTQRTQRRQRPQRR